MTYISISLGFTGTLGRGGCPCPKGKEGSGIGQLSRAGKAVQVCTQPGTPDHGPVHRPGEGQVAPFHDERVSAELGSKLPWLQGVKFSDHRLPRDLT